MLGAPAEQARDRVHCAVCRSEGGPRRGSAGRGVIRRSRPGGSGLLLKCAPCEARRSASRRAASARPRGGQASGTRRPALSCGAPPRSTHRSRPGCTFPALLGEGPGDPRARGPTARAASSSAIPEGCPCSPVAGGRGAVSLQGPGCSLCATLMPSGESGRGGFCGRGRRPVSLTRQWPLSVGYGARPRA
ncbi:Hypothetical protein GLP15_2613 [Giardia lamblia P15]|uniref:Uncharacterized protein n=1 Tax=Giardia intestinalis (strain P15) TaxID=658858 RepID=E1F8U4_GIAIA|nr:Hypothetical protein GLP15_2613 [Giardia lamblia P15]